MWFDESVFYQIYPLGYCGCERENDFGAVRHRLGEIEKRIPQIKEEGFDAVLFNPLFESERHGYDTVDFFNVDRRLGDNADFKALVEKFHEAGIRVVLDGVFNHVGRRFLPLRTCAGGANSPIKRIGSTSGSAGIRSITTGSGTKVGKGITSLSNSTCIAAR